VSIIGNLAPWSRPNNYHGSKEWSLSDVNKGAWTIAEIEKASSSSWGRSLMSRTAQRFSATIAYIGRFVSASQTAVDSKNCGNIAIDDDTKLKLINNHWKPATPYI
jgi:hypothetical protein